MAPFGKAEAEEFLDALLGDYRVGATGRSPLHDLKQLILEKTEGTPFFMEEVVQTLAEEGVLVGRQGQLPRWRKSRPELHISPTVQGVLAARIDRLAAEEKALLAAARRDRSRVPCELGPPSHHPTRRGIVSPPRLPPAQRVSLRAARLSGGRVYLQTCPDPGGRLRLGAARATQSLT